MESVNKLRDYTQQLSCETAAQKSSDKQHVRGWGVPGIKPPSMLELIYAPLVSFAPTLMPAPTPGALRDDHRRWE